MAIEHTYIDKTGKIAKQWGMGEPAGRVLGALLFSDSPLTQKEIAEKTGYTLSLVSPQLRLLENVGIVEKSRSGSKEKVYEVKISFAEVFHRMINRFLEEDIRPLIAELESSGDPRAKRHIAEYKKIGFYFSLFERFIAMKSGAARKIRNILR